MTLDMTTPPRDTAWGLILGIVAVGVGALIVSPLLKDLSTATGTRVTRGSARTCRPSVGRRPWAG